MADVSDLGPEDSPALAPTERQQAADVWLSHKREEVSSRGHGCSRCRKPQGHLGIEALTQTLIGKQICSWNYRATLPLHPEGIKP